MIEIWLYSFENWGEAQADKYHDELASSDVREGYRKYPVNRHLIFNRVAQDTLHIVRVLGNDMDYQRHI